MAERERRITPPFGGVFVARTQVLDADDVRRALWRMAHEIVERNHGLEDVILIGLQTGGVAFAAGLAEALAKIDGEAPPRGTLDVAFHRDDIGLRPVLPTAVLPRPVPPEPSAPVPPEPSAPSSSSAPGLPPQAAVSHTHPTPSKTSTLFIHTPRAHFDAPPGAHRV